MDSDEKEVLNEIRDSVKHLNGRLTFMEKRWGTGYEDLSQKMDAFESRLTTYQREMEMRLTTEIVSLAGVVHELAQEVKGRFTNHETRISALEKRGRR